MSAYRNPPTVVVVRVPVRTDRGVGLLMVRRALQDGKGKLAIPGGYQVKGKTWQEAGADEVLEETGLAVDPSSLKPVDVRTTPDRKVNLLFCDAPAVGSYTPVPERIAAWEAAGKPGALHGWLNLTEGQFHAWETSRHEVEEALVIEAPCPTAFPLHDVMAEQFFALWRARRWLGIEYPVLHMKGGPE